MYREVEVELHMFLTLTLNRMVSFMLQLLYYHVNSSWYWLD